MTAGNFKRQAPISLPRLPKMPSLAQGAGDRAYFTIEVDGKAVVGPVDVGPVGPTRSPAELCGSRLVEEIPGQLRKFVIPRIIVPDVLRADAMRYHAVYGGYGISVFAARGATVEELAKQVPLVRFATLTLIMVAAVRGAGLRLEPTGRNPRHYTVGFDDIEQGVAALAGCAHQVVPNRYHDA